MTKENICSILSLESKSKVCSAFMPCMQAEEGGQRNCQSLQPRYPAHTKEDAGEISKDYTHVLEDRIMDYIEQMLNLYYADDAKKLHGRVDAILSRFGGLWDKDRDDFYSLANEVFADVARRYEPSQSFEGFLYSCLVNRIKTEMTRRNREKRRTERMSVSIDEPVNGEEDLVWGDMIPGACDVEKEVFRKEEEFSKRMLAYLGRLSGLQKEVLRLSAAGYHSAEIKKKLNISGKQYADCNAAIHSYRNVSLLM